MDDRIVLVKTRLVASLQHGIEAEKQVYNTTIQVSRVKSKWLLRVLSSKLFSLGDHFFSIAALNLSLTMNFSCEHLTARSVSAKSATSSAEKTNVEIFQVKKIGSKCDPGWVFEAYGDRNILEGTLRKTLLGVLHIVNRRNCHGLEQYTVASNCACKT